MTCLNLDKTNVKKVDALKEVLGDLFDQIELVNADLMDKDSLQAAVAGCEYIVHVASPIPNEQPKDEMDVITPAVEGTIGMLEACVGSDVKKLIVTGSCVSIFDFTKGDREVDENDWSTLNDNMTPYFKSKRIAEEAAWKFFDELSEADKTFSMTMVMPGLVLGPLLQKSGGNSQEILTKMMNGEFKKVPAVYFPTVDVRDVADAHVAALKAEGNQRYAVTQGTQKMIDFANNLSGEFGQYGYPVS
jgi:dihydroflavonol-4-reductase